MSPSTLNLALCCLALALPAAAQQPLFPGARFESSLHPPDALLVDLDGDGHLDLVSLHDYYIDEVFTQLGDGAGGFGQVQSLSLPSQPTDLHSLEAGDIDGDGNLDLVVGAGDLAYVLLSDGQGGFGLPQTVGLGGLIFDLALEDLDGDGDLDLAAVGWDPLGHTVHHVWISLGDGQGGFAPATGHDVGDLPRAVAATDLDGDGDLDLVVATALTGAVSVLLGDGQGGFAPPQAHVAGPMPWAVEVGDMDGDGDPDVVVPNRVSAGTVSVLLNDGQGGLGPPLSVPAEPEPVDLQLLDLDGDGMLDVAAACEGMVAAPDGCGSLALLHGTGGGALGAKTVHFAGKGAQYLVSGDLDEDGSPDLLLGDRTSRAIRYLGAPQGDLVARPRLASGTTPTAAPEAVRLRDLDGDGHDDLVVANRGEDAVCVHLADGAGGFLPPMTYPTGSSPSDVQVADLDGDARLDLLVADEGDDEVVLLRGDGQGAFRVRARFSVAAGPRSIALGDVDLDGHLDALVACRAADRLSVLLGDGQGGFTLAPELPTPAGPEHVVLGDLDRDGRLDCVLACLLGKAVTLALGDGSGAFVMQTVLPLYGDTHFVEVRDFDGDGLLDVAVTQYGGAALTLWPGDGQGGLGSPSGPILGDDGMSAASGDLDGDGLVDLVLATWGTDEPLFVLLADGQGGYREPLTFAVGAGSSCVATGDLDGDGNLDLVVANAGSNDLTVLRNQLTPATACSDQVPYCRAKANSSGCLPRICSSGSPTLTGPDDFVVTADRVLTHNLGLLFWGLAGAATPFGGGTLCVGGPVTRAWVASAGGPPGVHDCSGAYVFPVPQAYLAAQGLSAGTQAFAQVWMRDPLLPAPHSYCLTNGLAFTVAP